MITLDDVRQARIQVSPYVKRTPLERNTTLSRELGVNVYLKLELFQKTGSFKPRGAFNQILQLTPDQRKHGVVGVSGGNFAQGLAYAGRALDTPVIICMPESTPRNYVEATRPTERRWTWRQLSPRSFRGQINTRRKDGISCTHSTALFRWPAPARSAWSCWRICRSLTDVVISIGGGGLIAGITVAIKALSPRRAFGVWKLKAQIQWGKRSGRAKLCRSPQHPWQKPSALLTSPKTPSL